MNIDLDRATVKLDRGHAHQLRNRRGSIIVVSWGTVWITQAGDRQDHILAAGEAFTINARGITLVHALQDAAISVLEPGTCHDAGAARRSLNSFDVRQIQREARRLRAERMNALMAKAGRALTIGFRWLFNRVTALLSKRSIRSGRTNFKRT